MFHPTSCIIAAATGERKFFLSGEKEEDAEEKEAATSPIQGKETPTTIGLINVTREKQDSAANAK